MQNFLAVLVVAGVVSAQSLQGLPQCAISCVASGLPANCNAEPKCICSSTSFINAISCCVSTSCSVEDQQGTLKYAQDICQPAGVTNLPTAAGCSGSASASGASATSGSASSGASSSAPTTTGGSIAQSASLLVSSLRSSADAATASASSIVESAASAASNAAASATSAASGDNSGEKLVAQWGAVGAGLLGVAAML